MAGKAYLIGAGPGDLGLMTLKGKALLGQAEVVLYDALLGAEIRALLPAEAELISVGKRAGKHLKSQAEINELLVARTRAGKRVVRLKGGDPFLFGRGGEEAEALSNAGLDYEIVPGVTSALAVPAYCGIPVTHRDCCSSVHIVTAHKKDGKQIPYHALVQTGGTLLFLMGASALAEVCTGLLDAGMDSKTPAAVLQKGTTAEQKVCRATLGTLAEAAVNIETPAIIAVGAVCGLYFPWREIMPLFGCRVIVTRPRNRAGRLSEALRTLGAEVLEIPTIQTVPMEENLTLETAMHQLSRYQWLVFTSPRGVELFFDKLREEKLDIRSLSGCKLAALGSGTGAALEARGLFPDLIPEIYDAPHLGRALRERLEQGDSVLIPRARQGDPALLEELGNMAEITEIPLYDTILEKPAAFDLAAELREHPQTMAVFTSASTVRGFAAAAGDVMGVTALCIGAQTAAQAEKYGMKTHIAKTASIDSLIELIQTVYKGEREL